jgi:hypothetical protein
VFASPLGQRDLYEIAVSSAGKSFLFPYWGGSLHKMGTGSAPDLDTIARHFVEPN